VSTVLLACDLDNTLIHSRKADGDICVERIGERENCFVSARVYKKLQEINGCGGIVPVTARSIEQYKRIHLFEKAVHYAITSAGGTLLIDNEVDPVRQAETQAIVYEQLPAMNTLFSLLLEDKRISLVKRVDNTFIFVKCKDSASLRNEIAAHVTSLEVVASGEKIYILPRGINKGVAIQELKDLLRPVILICAGDSVMDIPMLNIADIAIVPKNIAALVSAKEVVVSSQKDFAGFIVEFAPTL
jgi:HAD superfamily hydrolase (TIGR01484 family)